MCCEPQRTKMHSSDNKFVQKDNNLSLLLALLVGSRVGQQVLERHPEELLSERHHDHCSIHEVP